MASMADKTAIWGYAAFPPFARGAQLGETRNDQADCALLRRDLEHARPHGRRRDSADQRLQDIRGRCGAWSRRYGAGQVLRQRGWDQLVRPLSRRGLWLGSVREDQGRLSLARRQLRAGRRAVLLWLQSRSV